MNNEFRLLTGALRVFQDFSGTNVKKLTFVYDFNNINFDLLKHKYPIVKVAGKGDDLSKALNLLRWVYDNTWHEGTKDYEFLKKDSISILDYCFGKGIEFGINCVLQAIILTECCLAIGLKSRAIHCFPLSPYDFDSHVVSMVFIPSLNKWLMLDPTHNAYFMGSNGELLSPWEARENLASNCEITCNAEIDARSTQSLKEKTDWYKQYMSKDLFFITCSRINTFGTDLEKNQETLYFAPKGFNIAEREFAHCQYGIENTPPERVDFWKRELENHNKNIDKKKLLISLEQFMGE